MNWQFFTFKMHDRLFGVDITEIKEVIEKKKWTPVFHAPKVVKGYTNVRGQIYLVLDIAGILGYTSDDQEGFVMIFKSKVGEAFGVFLEAMGDIIQVNEENFEDIKTAEYDTDDVGCKKFLNLEIVSNICKVNGEVLTIIDANKILPHVEKKYIKLSA